MKVREWREKAALGTLTREEMREAIVLLRGDRRMAQEVGAVKKTRAKSGAAALLEDFSNQMKGDGDA